LKKELTDKEDRTRKLLTQLARAEEAAKRAIVKETGSSGGGGRSSRVAGANASKLFEQEKVIVELREKLRIMTTARDRCSPQPPQLPASCADRGTSRCLGLAQKTPASDVQPWRQC